MGVGRRPKFPRYGRSPLGLAKPGSALQQLHDVAGEGFFVPPGWQKTPQIVGPFPTASGRFRQIHVKRWGASSRRRGDWRKSSIYAG